MGYSLHSTCSRTRWFVHNLLLSTSASSWQVQENGALPIAPDHGSFLSHGVEFWWWWVIWHHCYWEWSPEYCCLQTGSQCCCQNCGGPLWKRRPHRECWCLNHCLVQQWSLCQLSHHSLFLHKEDNRIREAWSDTKNPRNGSYCLTISTYTSIQHC